MKIRVLSAGLLLALLAGCVELETTLTLNKDGSGTLEQTADLPAFAQLSFEGPMRGGQDQSPVLTEAAAERWKQNAATSGVTLLSFSSEEREGGSRHIVCKASFARLQDLAQTIWGYPFQFAVGRDGADVVLSFEDPVRHRLRLAAEGPSDLRALSKAPDPDHSLTLQEQATLDATRRLLAGLHVRTQVRLPAAASAAQGCVPTGDATRVVYDMTFGAGDSIQRYMAGERMSLRVPASALQLEPFERIAALRHLANRDVRMLDEAATNFTCRLTSLEVGSTRRVDYNPSGVRASTNEQFNLRLSVMTASGIRALGEDRRGLRGEVPAEYGLEVRDDTGADLVRERAHVYFHETHHPPGKRDADTNLVAAGEITISGLAQPAAGARRLACVQGRIRTKQVMAEKELVVKPLAAHLKEKYQIPKDAILAFDRMEPDKINYTLEWLPDTTAPDLKVEFFDAEGKALESGGSGSRSSGTRQEHERRLTKPVPEGCYAVVTYPTEVVECWIPFKLEDVNLP